MSHVSHQLTHHGNLCAFQVKWLFLKIQIFQRKIEFYDRKIHFMNETLQFNICVIFGKNKSGLGLRVFDSNFEFLKLSHPK